MSTVKEVYGTDSPTPPKGFTLGEFRKLINGERADWMDAWDHEYHFGDCEVRKNAGDWRYLLIPKEEGAV